jgi:hypothetical protein
MVRKLQSSEQQTSSNRKAKLKPELVNGNGQVVTLEQVSNLINQSVASAQSFSESRLLSQVETAIARILNGPADSQPARAQATFESDPPKSTVMAEGTGVPAAVSPVDDAMNNMTNALVDAHELIESLIVMLEPHLPRHVYDDQCKEDGGCTLKASRVDGYSSAASSTVNRVNSATNEVDRLSDRIRWLRHNLIV